MDTIYLLGSHPRDLTIAVRTGRIGYHGAYRLVVTAHGWSDCDLITDSDQFIEVELTKLPASLKDDFDFNKKLPYLDKAFIHRPGSDGSGWQQDSDGQWIFLFD